MEDKTTDPQPENPCDALPDEPKPDRFEAMKRAQAKRERDTAPKEEGSPDNWSTAENPSRVYHARGKGLLIEESRDRVIYTLTAAKSFTARATDSTITLVVDRSGEAGGDCDVLESITHRHVKATKRDSQSDRIVIEWNASEPGVYNLSHHTSAAFDENHPSPGQRSSTSTDVVGAKLDHAFDPKAVLAILATRNAEVIYAFLASYLPPDFHVRG